MNAELRDASTVPERRYAGVHVVRRTRMLAGEIGEGIRAWRARLLRRLDGLDDQEYLWEPVDGCWSVRRRPDGHWTPDLGPRGSTWTPEDPPPVTTIAWRLWHLGGCPDPTWPAESAVTAREFADLWFAQAPQSTGGAFGAASEAIAGFDRHWTAVADSVTQFSTAELLEPVGQIGGRFGASSIHGLVIHVADELIHHSAEIALLRDLYRAGLC